MLASTSQLTIRDASATDGECLAEIVQQSTLMSIDLYNEPAGAYVPSILF